MLDASRWGGRHGQAGGFHRGVVTFRVAVRYGSGVDPIQGDAALSRHLQALGWPDRSRKLRDWRQTGTVGPVLRRLDPGVGGRGQRVVYPVDVVRDAGLLLNAQRFVHTLRDATILAWMWGANLNHPFIVAALNDAIAQERELAKALSRGAILSRNSWAYGKRSRASEQLPQVLPGSKRRTQQQLWRTSGQVAMGTAPHPEGWDIARGLVDVTQWIPESVDVLESVLSLNLPAAAEALKGMSEATLQGARSVVFTLLADRMGLFVPDENPMSDQELDDHRNKFIGWWRFALIAPAVPALVASLRTKLGPIDDG
jgi:hypothetical protein